MKIEDIDAKITNTETELKRVIDKLKRERKKKLSGAVFTYTEIEDMLERIDAKRRHNMMGGITTYTIMQALDKLAETKL